MILQTDIGASGRYSEGRAGHNTILYVIMTVALAPSSRRFRAIFAFFRVLLVPERDWLMNFCFTLRLVGWRNARADKLSRSPLSEGTLEHCHRRILQNCPGDGAI